MRVIKKFFNKISTNQKGNILLMSMLVLTSILMASLTIANLTLSGIIISGTQVRSIKAYYAADAGIEESLYWSRASTTATSTLEIEGVVASSSLSNDSSYTVNYTTWNSGNVIGTSTREGGYVRNLNSEGEFANLRRTVEAQFGFIPWFEIEVPCSNNSLNMCDTEFKCEAIGYGYWYSSTCNTVPPGSANAIASEAACEAGNDYWHEPSSICFDMNDPDDPETDYEPGVCSPAGLTYCQDQSTCEEQSGYWYFSSCNEQPCDCDNEQDCVDVGGRWYNNTCNQYCDSANRTLCESETECQSYGSGVWCLDQCLSNWGVCNDEATCLAAGWYWFANTTCNEHCDLTNQSLCYTELECETPNYGNGYWYNDTCNATPE